MTHDKVVEILSNLKEWLRAMPSSNIDEELLGAIDIAIDCVEWADEEPILAIEYMIRDLKTAGISFDTTICEHDLVKLSYPDCKLPIFEVLEIEDEEKFVKLSKYDDVGNVVTLDKVKWGDAFDAIFHYFRIIHGF